MRYSSSSPSSSSSSPSPSDLCWVIGFTPHGRWIAPVVRAAVGLELQEARQIAAAHLGDEALASEIMELAIQQTAGYPAELSPVGIEEVRAILARAYHNEVRRRRRAGNKFSFRGTATEVEILSPFTDLSFTAVEAELDLDKMLRETPADLRAGMLLRYGARRRWSEVAQEVAQPKEAVRKRCEREMERIRKRLGFEKGPHRDRPH
jgi:DNA-directed RNA polymerase specialized sigma24 family protein